MVTLDSITKEELSAAQIVAKHVDLLAINMLSGSFEVKSSGVFHIDNMEPKIALRPKYVFDEKEKDLTINIAFVVLFSNELKNNNADENEKSIEDYCLKIESLFSLKYKLNTEPPPSEKQDFFFNGFAKINGAFNAWPYLREYVQSTITRTGLSPVTLPTFKVPPPSAKTETPQQSSTPEQ